MHYKVKARLIPQRASELLRKLTDGTILAQKPDGQEIVESMGRAKIDEAGIVRWSEVCYCPTPLEHERLTVYDRYFADLQTEQVNDYVEFEGEDFLDHVARLGGGGQQLWLLVLGMPQLIASLAEILENGARPV